jgi:hypothetical protein
MSEFDSLDELTAELTIGDKILWIGSHAVDSVGEHSAPNTVTNIKHTGEEIRVDGEGVGGGKYHFTVEDGDSCAYYHNSNQPDPICRGEVVVARITDSDDPVPVKKVFDDIRNRP